jgi:uncharacterized Zn-binding protein involved in type VI secretion
MKRYMIVQGDKTTSDGVVLEGDPTTRNEGKPLAYHGATVQCPKCHSIGHIVGVGPSMPMTFMSRQVALENDLCMCKCNPPPRLIASLHSMSMSFESHVLAQMGYGQGSSSDAPEQWNFIAFRLADGGSAEGLECIAHFDDGTSASGAFDEKNTVRFDNPSGKVCQRVTLKPDTSSEGTFCSSYLSTLTA